MYSPVSTSTLSVSHFLLYKLLQFSLVVIKIPPVKKEFQQTFSFVKLLFQGRQSEGSLPQIFLVLITVAVFLWMKDFQHL